MMGHFWSGYWWSILPFAGIALAALVIWAEFRRRQHALDLLKTFAEQGKEPPPELLKAVRAALDGPFGSGDTGAAARRGGHWPTVIVFTAMSLAFASADLFMTGETRMPFTLVAVMFGVMAVGFFFLALAQSRQKGE